MIEYTIPIPAELADDKLAQCYLEDIVNVFYESPVHNVRDENGYRHETEDTILFKVYEETKTPDEAFMTKLATLFEVEAHTITTTVIQDVNWQQPQETIELSNGWTVVPANHATGEDNVLLFDHQGAFGTGLHETTRDCLTFILDRSFEADTILDLGTGSGILSLAAGVKGAHHIDAIDIEPVEREITLNAKQNDVNTIHVSQMNLLQQALPIKHYDWCFINIGAEETMTMLKEQPLFTKEPPTHLLISGLVEWNTERVTSFLKSFHYEVTEKNQTKEWVTVIAHYKNNE